MSIQRDATGNINFIRVVMEIACLKLNILCSEKKINITIISQSVYVLDKSIDMVLFYKKRIIF
jgi:hypothetical protein